MTFQPGTGTTGSSRLAELKANEFSRMAPGCRRSQHATLAIRYRGDRRLTAGRKRWSGQLQEHQWPDLDAAVPVCRGARCRARGPDGREHGRNNRRVLPAPCQGHLGGHGRGPGPARAQSAADRGVGGCADCLPRGLSLPAPVTWGAERLTSWRFGLTGTPPTTSRTPAGPTAPLVFHGDADTTVPIATSREFAAADSPGDAHRDARRGTRRLVERRPDALRERVARLALCLNEVDPSPHETQLLRDAEDGVARRNCRSRTQLLRDAEVGVAMTGSVHEALEGRGIPERTGVSPATRSRAGRARK